MKIFISWSGVRSEHLAEHFRWFLRHVLPGCEPFYSRQSIAKGTRGLIVLAKELAEAEVGIVMLTPENIHRPWVLFEAGALSKHTTSYLCTFLFEVEETDVESPLGDFQNTKNNEKDIRQLVGDLNSLLKQPRPIAELNESLDVWLPKLQERLAKIPPKPDDEAIVEKPNESDMLREVLHLLRKQNSSISQETVIAIVNAELLKHTTGGRSSTQFDAGIRSLCNTVIANNGYAPLGFVADHPALERAVNAGVVVVGDGTVSLTSLGKFLTGQWH